MGIKHGSATAILFIAVISSLVLFSRVPMSATVEQESVGQIMSADELAAEWMHVCNDVSGRTRSSLEAAGEPMVDHNAIDERLSNLLKTVPGQPHRKAKNAVWLFKVRGNQRHCGLLVLGFTSANVFEAVKRLTPDREWNKFKRFNGYTKYISHLNIQGINGAMERISYCVTENFPAVAIGSALNAAC